MKAMMCAQVDPMVLFLLLRRLCVKFVLLFPRVRKQGELKVQTQDQGDLPDLYDQANGPPGQFL